MIEKVRFGLGRMSEPIAGKSPGDVTRLLNRLQGGDRKAESQLIPLVYNELRRLASAYMRRERSDHTLQSTALVHEAYIRLSDQKNVSWQNRAHFFAVAAQLMRRILVDHARARLAQKRAARPDRIQVDKVFTFTPERSNDLLALDEVLNRLGQKDPRTLQVVELRFFGGLTVEEAAEALGISPRTIKREWNFGRAWLRAELEAKAKTGGDPDDPGGRGSGNGNRKPAEAKAQAAGQAGNGHAAGGQSDPDLPG